MSYKLQFHNDSTPPLSAENVNNFMQTFETNRVPMYAVTMNSAPAGNIYTATLSSGQSLYSSYYNGVIPLNTGDSFTVYAPYGIVKASYLIITDDAGHLYSTYPIVDYKGNANIAYPNGVILDVKFNSSIISGGAYVISSGSGGGGSNVYTGNLTGPQNGFCIGSTTTGSVSAPPIIIGTDITYAYDFVVVTSVKSAGGNAFACVKQVGDAAYTYFAYNFPTPTGGCSLLLNPIILLPGDTLNGYCDNASYMMVSYVGYTLDGSTQNTYHRVCLNSATYASRRSITVPASSNGMLVISNVICNIGSAAQSVSSSVNGSGYLLNTFSLPIQSSIECTDNCGFMVTTSKVFENTYGDSAASNGIISYILLRD